MSPPAAWARGHSAAQPLLLGARFRRQYLRRRQSRRLTASRRWGLTAQRGPSKWGFRAPSMQRSGPRRESVKRHPPFIDSPQIT
jgi:hypothetical protein